MLNKTKYKTFSERPFEVFKKDILQKGFRTSPSSQRSIKSTVGVPLKKQVDSYFNGKEIGSEAYVNKSFNRFIKTGNIQNDLLLDLTSVEYCKTTNNEMLKGNEILIAEDGGGDGLGESCLYVKDNKYSDYLCNGILALRIEDTTKRNYILGFLKSKYFKEFIDNNTPVASTLRHSNGVAKEFTFPLFDDENIKHKLISLLVNNLMDKERQLKERHNNLDYIIYSELHGSFSSNVESTKNFFVMNNFKCSAKLYDKKYVEFYESIQQYKNGFFNILKEFSLQRGTSLALDSVGLTLETDKRLSKKQVVLITGEDFENRVLKSIKFLGVNKNIRLVDDSVLLNATGKKSGKCIYIGKINDKIATNYNQWIIRKIGTFPLSYIYAFLSYYKKLELFDYFENPSNGGFIVEEHFNKFVFIPNFPTNLINSINMVVENNLTKHKNNIDNYISNEKQRNKELGIWQLNLECIALKHKINKLVEKIILNKKIHTPYFLT